MPRDRTAASPGGAFSKGGRDISEPMLFAELDAGPDLRTWVDRYWHFRVASDAGTLEHWVPPDGGLTLAFDPRTRYVGLSGPWLLPCRPPVHPGMVNWGVRFWPGAGQALLGIDPRASRDRFSTAAEVLAPELLASLHEALEETSDQETIARGFDRWLRQLAARQDARPLDGAVMTAVFRLVRSGGRERIGEIAEHVALSPRQLRRRFQSFVGLSPKEFARIRRFRASAIEAVEASSPWVDVAANHGYADQAHLVHEYRRLIGLSPKAFESQFAKIHHRLKER